MEQGPFEKDHELFALIRSGSFDEHRQECMGFTYETPDKYAAIWFKSVASATAFRDAMNKHMGWSIISKPDMLSSNSDLNPFTCDAVCVCPLPKDIADRNDKYGGDAMAAALDVCRQAGIEVRI